MDRKKFSIGKLAITENQFLKAPSLIDDDKILGYVRIDGEIFIYSFKDLSKGDLKKITDDFLALPDEKPQNEKEKDFYKASPLYGMTHDEARIWVNQNVTDIASAKNVISNLAAVVAMLLKRSELSK